jgi:ribonuclease P/MRP protein subunit POP1
MRDYAEEQAALDPPMRIVKKKSRRVRRRSKSIMEEFGRRQRDKVWLETHIWHAKRMKMETRWGFRVAVKANMKCYRSVYRASQTLSLIHDESYTRTIEISGAESEIVECLRLIFDPLMAGPGSKRFKGGQRFGGGIVYAGSAWPCGAIGPVEFLWKQETVEQGGDGPTQRCIWILVHPGIQGQVLRAINDATSMNGKCIKIND